MKIINRTPHPITIHQSGTASEAAVITIPAAPRGEIARVETTSQLDAPLIVELASQDSEAIDGKAQVAIPVALARWGRVVGLPAPHVFYKHVVSVIVAAAAHAEGRDISDLYVPGDQVRDASGRIVGCMALAPAATALPGRMLAWRPSEVIGRIGDAASLLCYRDDTTTGEQPFASRRRGNFPVQDHYIVRRPEAHGGGYVRVVQEWGTDAWSWSDITVEQAASEYAAPQPDAAPTLS